MTEESEEMQLPSNGFSRQTDESKFKSRNRLHLHTTTVCILYPPYSPSVFQPRDPHIAILRHRYLFTANGGIPWTAVTIDGGLRHPLTLKHHLSNLPKNFKLSKLKLSTFKESRHHFTSSFDKVLLVPTPTPKFLDVNNNYLNKLNECTLLVLYDGGQLRGCLPSSDVWLKLSCYGGVDKFDDIAVFEGNIYVVDRQGKLYLINSYLKWRKLCIGKTLIGHPVDPGSGRFGWRKRLVIGWDQLYLVVRIDEKMLEVYKLDKQGKVFNWDKVERGFWEEKVLFMARDYYFFCRAETKFPGRQYENCTVFSEAAFPQYGNDCWEFSQFDRQFGEEDIAVFRLTDGTFAREDENGDFPTINWSPPPWVFDAWSGLAAKSQIHSSADAYRRYSQSEREPEKDEGLKLNNRDGNDGEVQCDLIGQNKEDGQMQCYFKSQEKEDEEIHSNANIEGGASLQQDLSSSLFGREFETTGTVTPSVSAAKEVTRTDSDSQDENDKMQCDQNSQANEDEVTRTRLCINGGNDAIDQGTLTKNITQLIPRARRSCITKCHRSDSVTTKFEGFDVKSDLVITLQKIWQQHGNIIENSTMRSGYILARALESLAIMVQILDDNSGQSLSDPQAEFLNITLSDLRCICFKVDWLIPFVEKAIKLHKSKPLFDSLNNLSQLSSQVEERRVILFDELAKLDEEANKLKEEMAKVSEMIPFSGKVKFDELLGSGLT